jgi:AraC-like DNA-binding protein
VERVFSTAEVSPGERLAALREVVSEEFLRLRVDALPDGGDPASVRGSVSTRELDTLRVARFSGTPVAAVRTPDHIDASPGDDYLLALHTKGVARVRQAGRDLTLRPGDMALLDSALPYAIELRGEDEFGHIAYRVPRAQLDVRADGLERALAVRVTRESDAGALAAPYLRTLASSAWSTPAAAAGAWVETGLDLLAGALIDAAGLDRPRSRRAEALIQLKRHARLHLGEPHLSPRVVAEANYVSVRQLHRLFDREDETFAAWVRGERLLRCRRDLADPRLRELSIAEIARRWGFRSPAHFTRAFSARFGVPPSEHRAVNALSEQG